MNIEKIRELNCKARRNLVKTTDDLQLLILLADDKSVRVRKEILHRYDVPFEALSKMYKNSSTSRQKREILRCLKRFGETEKVRALLNQMFDDEDYEFVVLAMRLYRNVFTTLKELPNMCSKIFKTDSKEYLEDWVIHLPGYAEARDLAENPNVVQELAHRFIIADFAFEKNKFYLQEMLYDVLSHEKIEERTLQYIFGAKENESFEEDFYAKPKYAIATCKSVSTEMLDALMDGYQSDFEHYFDDSFNESYSNKFFAIFFSALVSNPNCSKRTFEKAFNLFIKVLKIDCPNALLALRKSKFYSLG